MNTMKFSKAAVASAFSLGNFDAAYIYLTGETIWNTPGEFRLTGKEEIQQHCQKVKTYFDNITTDFQQLEIIENENNVVITGKARFIKEGKCINQIASCDVYKFANDGTIISITSYCVSEKEL